MLRRNSFYKCLLTGTILFFVLFIFAYKLNLARAAGESDAIAVRILPNPNHLSISRWYSSQNIGGSPQSLKINGYEAIRNGRSVYIAASNISQVTANNRLTKDDKLYTNVYMISYNQEVIDSTLDIFGQLLANWKFNSNIMQPGRCKRDVSTVCSYNSECAIDDYCLSSRSVILRDVERLANTVDMNTALADYKKTHGGFCPKLLSGTYIPTRSVSTWPSWQATLGNELSIALPIDPINKLGICNSNPTENGKYDSKTCWDETNRRFASSTDTNFKLPADSLAYSYSVNYYGTVCSFSVPTESGLTCDNNGTCIVSNNLFDATNGYCGDSSAQADLREQCDDGNKVDDDVCTNGCKWTVKEMPTIPFSLNGIADALVYDDNATSISINNTSNGSYLKLDKMLDTPYAWFADTNNSLITQVRTYVKCYPYGSEKHPDDRWNLDPSSKGKTGYVCPKKMPDGWDYSEANHQHPGQIINDYSVVGYPSRTAVNVESNEVWVAARSGSYWGLPGHVEKLQMDVNGDYLSVATIPSSKFSGFVRGLSIQRNGDIWTADCTGNARTSSIKRFSASNLELNKTIGNDNSFVCPYGLAIDSSDNIWMNDMGGGGMKKVNAYTGQISTFNNAGIYGITVDNNDNTWGGGYIYGYGIKKIPVGQNSGSVIHYTGFKDWQTNMTGVTLDRDGNIWSGGYTPYNETYKFNQSGQLQPGFPVTSGGVNPHGVFGTSDGYVWQSHISSNVIRVFNKNGGLVADFKGGKIAGGIYTYSDATGLNRAMVMRSGLWVSNPVDSGKTGQHWGHVFWQQDLKSDKQTLEVYARAADEINGLKNKIWVRVYLEGDPNNIGETWNALNFTDPSKVGRYMQFKILLKSSERGVTPVIWDLHIK